MKFGWIVVFSLGACAHIEPPPGGPQDSIPPALILTRPDTLAVVPNFTGPAALVFEDRLSERGIEDAILISPLTSAPNIDHRGSEIRVSLRRGWQPGRIYQITVLPGLQDLWNNRIRQPTTLTFSTGPPIPDTRVTGRVLDRVTGRAEVGTRVEAILRPDSLVYATATDSAGAFTFARIPAGTYSVRAFRDINRNRSLDSYEANDTALALVQAGATDTAAIRLAVLPPDSTPPALASAQAADSIVELRFDDFLDPAQVLSTAQVQISGPGGQGVPVTAVRPGGGAGAAPDTAQRLPSQTLLVQPAAPLAPAAEYRIRVEGVRNLRGLLGGGETTMKTPAETAARS